MCAKEAPRIPWLVEPTFDADGVQATSGLGPDGREHPDPVPLRPPLDLKVSQGDELHTAIRNIFLKERALFNAAVELEQFETEEEANDFVTEDDIFPPGQEPWEDVFEFPAANPGGAVSEPALASRPANGGTAAETADPHTAPSGAASVQSRQQTASGGSLPASTSSGSSAETPTSVQSSGQGHTPSGNTRSGEATVVRQR